MIQEAIKYISKADKLDKLKIYMDYYIHNMRTPYDLEFVDKNYKIPKGYEDRITKFNTCIIRSFSVNSMTFEDFTNQNVKYREDSPIIAHLWRFYKRIGINLYI